MRYQERIKQDIDRYGQNVTGVSANPPFFYTIGNHAVGLPELLVIAPLNAEVAVGMLNILGRKQRQNARAFKNHELYHFQGGLHPVALVDVSTNPLTHEEYVIQADNFFNTQVRVLQLVLPDENGRFPWEPECQDPWAKFPVLSLVY